MNIHGIVSIVVEYLETLPDGTGVSTYGALERLFGASYVCDGKNRIGDVILNTGTMFDIDDQVRMEAYNHGIDLDCSHCKGIPVGLPFNITHIVSKKYEYPEKHNRHLLFQEGGTHKMTWFHLKRVAYSQEYGAPELPKLAVLVSDTPDPHKDIILDYLGEHCIAGCPGIEYDVVNTHNVIGHGHLYADDQYVWTDYFANYVRKYNIPVPPEFRAHILENYKSRKKRHTKHRLLKAIRIINQPESGHCYSIHIHQNGDVCYQNSSHCQGEDHFRIDAEEADWIVHPITESTFCYDEPPAAAQPDHGYRWAIEFYSAKGLVYKAEGWPGEPQWRYKDFQDLLRFVEWKTDRNLGSDEME